MSTSNGHGDPVALVEHDHEIAWVTWRLSPDMSVEQQDQLRRLRLDQLRERFGESA